MSDRNSTLGLGLELNFDLVLVFDFALVLQGVEMLLSSGKGVEM